MMRTHHGAAIAIGTAIVIASAQGGTAAPAAAPAALAPTTTSASGPFAASGISNWSVPPAATKEPRYRPPIGKRFRLRNGLTVVVVENHELPIVAMTLLVPGAGAAADPPGRLGLASFTADLLDEGSDGMTALAIAQEQDRLGAEIQISVDVDAAEVAVRTLSKTLEPTIDLLARILTQPSFEVGDLERVRSDRATALAQRRDRPREVAWLMLTAALYGSRGPYGHPLSGFPADLRACSLADVRDFYQRRWDPARMTLAVAGAVDFATLQTSLQASFGRWKAAAAVAPSAPMIAASALPAGPPRRLLVADRPGADQSDIRIGLIGPARNDPRFYSFEVLRTLLGDGFTSRLTQRLREQLGITYGVRATMDWRVQRGPFSIATAIVSAETRKGILETIAILDDFARRPVTRAELEKGKQNLIRALPAEFETQLGTTEAIVALAQFGLPLDWYAQYASRIRRVTARDVQIAARSFLSSQQMVFSVVGDLSKISADLAALGLGSATLHDGDGSARVAPVK